MKFMIAASSILFDKENCQIVQSFRPVVQSFRQVQSFSRSVQSFRRLVVPSSRFHSHITSVYYLTHIQP